VKNERHVEAFGKLGSLFQLLGEEKNWTGYSLGITQEEYERLQVLIHKQFSLNGWFTKESVCNSLKALATWLTKENLNAWLSKYSIQNQQKRVGVIMAGNIPMVGFHDFLCVVLSGNKAIIKLSSDDKTLLPAFLEVLFQFEPSMKDFIEIPVGKLGQIDALIATGSNNSSRYFESYFGHLPHIFRKNRTSVAIITGNESKEELQLLGRDMFDYFGLGCRNVSQLFIPKGYQLDTIFEAILPYSEIINHHKYANNYDYNKAIHLMNQENILENGFVLLKESDELFSPLAMIYYKEYSTQDEVENFLANNQENIQAIVGHNYIPFGAAQCPSLSDYADQVDTMQWLITI
jgi:hypothetical protein